MNSARALQRRLCFSLLALTAALAQHGAARGAEIEFDAQSLLARGVSYRLQLADGAAAIELRRGELFEDDGPAAGYSYKPNVEKLSDRVWIRKELLIPNPRASRATLLVGPGGKFQARVNCKLTDLQDAGKADNYWRAYVLPPESLKSGRNTITLSGGGQVWIARDDERAAGAKENTKPPNRSARSADAGQTWDANHLGADGAIDGEYYVRVFLDHYCSTGRLTLPVLDLANLSGDGVAPPIAALGPVRIETAADLPPGSHLRLRTRCGPAPAPDRHWSAWQELAGKELSEPSGRYVQVDVAFSTTDPLVTPRLRSVTVAADITPGDDWTRGVRVRDAKNERIVRSSIPFRYEPFDQPRLRELRQRFELDSVADPASNEFELLQRLARWSSRRWEKGHLKDGYPAWDALQILQTGADGAPVGGFCQQYNLVFLQACESFGLPGAPSR